MDSLSKHKLCLLHTVSPQLLIYLTLSNFRSREVGLETFFSKVYSSLNFQVSDYIRSEFLLSSVS